jgi:hypothetical protein
VLHGSDLVLLAVYVQCFPHATGLEKIAFLYQVTRKWYNEGQIAKAEQHMACPERNNLLLQFKLLNPDMYSSDKSSGICHILLALQILAVKR